MRTVCSVNNACVRPPISFSSKCTCLRCYGHFSRIEDAIKMKALLKKIICDMRLQQMIR